MPRTFTSRSISAAASPTTAGAIGHGDPRWFVAVHKEDTEWVVEAAIPLAALTSDGVTPGRAWCCNVIRTLPGRGVQAWSLPAEAPEEAMRPEGMGLLIFMQDGKVIPERVGAAAP